MAITFAKNIYQNLPDDALLSAEKSFLYSTVIATALSFGNLTLAVQMASIAALASIVDSIVSTILKTYFQVDQLKWYQNYCKLALSLSLNNYLCYGFLHHKIGIVFTIASNFMADLFSGLQDCQMSQSTIMRNYRWFYLISKLVSFFKLSEVNCVRFFMGFF